MPAHSVSHKIVLGSYGLPILGDIPFVQDFSFARWPFAISTEEAMAHWHIIGKSGSGKSFFLAKLYKSLFDAGFGVTLIDPHGTLAPLIFSLFANEGFFESTDAYEK